MKKVFLTLMAALSLIAGTAHAAGGGIAWSVGEIPNAILALLIVFLWSRSDAREECSVDQLAKIDCMIGSSRWAPRASAPRAAIPAPSPPGRRPWP